MKMQKCITVAACACAVLAGGLTAQAGMQTGTAKKWVHSIYVEGQHADYVTDEGTLLYPLSYQDSVYIPLRAVGDWMGKTVSWDAGSRTITLSGNTPQEISFTNPVGDVTEPGSLQQNVPVQVCPDISVVLDGSKKLFKSASGDIVYPLIQDGISYLPIRAVGELTGMQVSWTNQGGIQTIYLTTKSSDEEIQQARAYLANIRPHIEIIKKSGEALKSATDLDTMSLNLKVIQEENDKIQSMAVPDGKLMDVYAEDIHHECDKIQQVCTEILTLVNKKADVSTCIDAIWGETAEHFQHAQILIGHYLENVLDQAERVLAQQ